jgi:hypothetical protein
MKPRDSPSPKGVEPVRVAPADRRGHLRLRHIARLIVHRANFPAVRRQPGTARLPTSVYSHLRSDMFS